MIITKGTTTPLGRTVRLGGILLCAALLSLVLVQRASAADFCVDIDATGACPAGTPAPVTLDTAIASSISNGVGTTDFIYIASGTYTSAGGYNFADSRVRVKGVGPTTPVLTLSGNPSGISVLETSQELSQFENLKIEIPASGTNVTGFEIVEGGTSVKDVSVNGTSGTGFSVVGQNPTLSRPKVSFSGNQSVGISLNGASSTIIDDAEITANIAVSVDGLSQNFKVSRMYARAATGLEVFRSSGTISSSVIAPNPTTAFNEDVDGIIVRAGTDPSTVRVSNVTLIGESGGVGIVANSNGAASATVDVNSSLVLGYDFASGAFKSSTGGATIALGHTRYQGTLNASGTGTVTAPATTQAIGDPGFAPGTYRPALASPLVDAGDPGPLDPTDSASDLAGNPRVVSRGAGNVRDIGAYEVQNSTPQPVIAILTPSPSTTSAVQFSAAGSSDAEGDPITFDWKFDGTSFATGVTPAKLFNTEGPHVVQLTATDKTGAGKTVSQQFNVAKGFLTLALKSQNAHLTASGDFSIKITCPAAAATDCTGRLLFQTVKKLSANQYYVKPSKKKSKPKTISAGNHVFRVEPGTTATAKVRAYRTFRNVLKKYSNIKIQSTLISGSTANAVLTAPRATFTISAPKKKKK